MAFRSFDAESWGSSRRPQQHQQPHQYQKANTVASWSNLPGKSLLIDQLARLKARSSAMDNNSNRIYSSIAAVKAKNDCCCCCFRHNNNMDSTPHGLKSACNSCTSSSGGGGYWDDYDHSADSSVSSGRMLYQSFQAKNVLQPECWNGEKSVRFSLPVKASRSFTSQKKRESISLSSHDVSRYTAGVEEFYTAAGAARAVAAVAASSHSKSLVIVKTPSASSLSAASADQVNGSCGRSRKRDGSGGRRSIFGHRFLQLPQWDTLSRRSAKKESETAAATKATAKVVAEKTVAVKAKAKKIEKTKPVPPSHQPPLPPLPPLPVENKALVQSSPTTTKVSGEVASPSSSSSSSTTPKNSSGESDPGYESDPANAAAVAAAAAANGAAVVPAGSSVERKDKTEGDPLSLVAAAAAEVAEVADCFEPITMAAAAAAAATIGEDLTPVTMQIFAPIRLEQRDVAASQTLRAALCKVEASHPGFSYDLVLGLVKKAEVAVNMNESLLRLQGTISEQDNVEYKSSRTEEPFQELNKKSVSLKRILSRIPDEITDRKTFLETIKEIASAIKKLLDAVNDVSAYIPGTQGKQALEQRKREFVKYSKRFSNTLKEYFKEGQPNSVFASATYLIYQTNQLMITVKNKCE